jgi:hypothetical protein
MPFNISLWDMPLRESTAPDPPQIIGKRQQDDAVDQPPRAQTSETPRA